MTKRNKALLGIVCLLSVISTAVYRRVMPGALFLSRFMDEDQGTSSDGEPFDMTTGMIASSKRDIPVRVYTPKSGYESVLLLVHGVHFAGYDEARLVQFAKLLAGLGHVVVTPDIEDLKTYEISEVAVEEIETSARWVLDDSKFAGEVASQKLGMLGISFSGGLCLSVASRASMRGSTKFVFSFGGHGDLKETMTYLVTGDLPDGEKLPPHIYGQAVLARQFADQLVPPSEVELLRSVLLEYLKEEFSLVRSKLGTLGTKSRHIVELVLNRDKDALGALLKPLVENHKPPPVLSPVQGDPPSCPVFLLHGSVDNVIPPSQTLALEKWASSKTTTTTLVSDLIKHVELGDGDEESSSIKSYWHIICFWTDLLRT